MPLLQTLPTNTRIGFGYANGTFGELLQGGLGDPCRHFLVTLPISKFSTVIFVEDDTIDDIIVFPRTKTKARTLAKTIVQQLGVKLTGRLYISSEIPEGKGMASSSADLVATAKAIASATSVPIDDTVLQSKMCVIEPTDGVMYQGVVSYFHRLAKLDCLIGEMFDCRIVALDEGGLVDTIEYNNHLTEYNECEKVSYRELLTRMKSAFRARDLRTIGELTTKSALLNQVRNPKKNFETICRISARFDAVGVVAAHSGSCIGILVDKNDAEFEQKQASILAEVLRLPGHVFTLDTLSEQQVSVS